VVGPDGALGAAGVADEPPVDGALGVDGEDELAEGSLTEAEVVEVVVAALVVVVVAGGGALATPGVGTVSGGAPAVLVVDGDPPPQAERPTLATSRVRMTIERLIVAERALGAQGLHTPAAVGAVV
jgi:hypothetical protein